MGVLEPAPVYMPKHNQKIGVIDRSLPSDDNAELDKLDKVLSAEGKDLDKEGAHRAVLGLSDKLGKNQNFDEVKIIEDANLRSPGSGVFPATLPWETVQKICDENGVDALYVLSFYDTDSKIDYKTVQKKIKNPLGGVRGAAQLLESELEDETLKEYTTIIISEADRLKNLVDRMLGARKPNENQATNIHEVLERVRHLVKADIPENVNLSFDYDPSIPTFNADLDNLIQIVLNLVVNALKAVGDSGNIQFKTRVMRNHIINHKQHKLSLRLEIKDDGSGVPDDIRDKLFFPMISGSADGTGLGLSIAQSLAQRQNGVIEFESQAGATCFVLALPIDNP